MSCDNVITVQDLETDKKHSTFYREVITGKAGGTGADIDSATNAVTGQTQATLPKVLSNVGFSPAGFDFTTGGTLTERDKAIFYQADGNWYSWGGALPKVVPPASSPASTGGIADNAWNVSTSAFMYRDWEGFTAELLAQAGIVDDGQPDDIGNSKRVDAISKICGRRFASVYEMVIFHDLQIGDRYGTGCTVWEYTGFSLGTIDDFKALNHVNVKDFGAKGDGVNDDQPPIQSAVNFATRNGGSVFVPPGYYRLKAPVNIGAAFYNSDNDLTFIKERTQPIDDPTDISKQNIVNKSSNALLKRIDFTGTSSTYFIADFYPSAYRPVIAYNLDNDSFDNTGSIKNINVIADSHYVNGKYDPSTSNVYSNNKHVGVYVGRGCSVAKKIMTAGLGVGLISNRQYWTSIDSVKIYSGGDGVHLSAYNQAKASNMNVHTCLRAFIFDGQAGEMNTFGTENCGEDFIVLSADACKFSTAYLEDVRTSGGSGKFSIVLGHTANSQSNLITHSNFDNIMVLNISGSSKKGIMFNSCDKSTLAGCRTYGREVVTDSTSLSALNFCDFEVDQFYNNSVLKKMFTPELRDSEGHTFTLSSSIGVVSVVGTMATIDFDITWTSKGSAVAGSPVIVTFPLVYPLMKSSNAVLVSGLTSSTQIHAQTAVGAQFVTLKKSGAGAASNCVVSDLSQTGSLSFSISVQASLYS